MSDPNLFPGQPGYYPQQHGNLMTNVMDPALMISNHQQQHLGQVQQPPQHQQQPHLNPIQQSMLSPNQHLSQVQPSVHPGVTNVYGEMPHQQNYAMEYPPQQQMFTGYQNPMGFPMQANQSTLPVPTQSMDVQPTQLPQQQLSPPQVQHPQISPQQPPIQEESGTSLPVEKPAEPEFKTPKKGRGRTPKKKSELPATPEPTVPKVKEYVSILMDHKLESFQDKEFAEKILTNLTKKISSKPDVVNDWIKAIKDKDTSTGCVCISRPREGRITVTKSMGNSGSKKVFPQIVVFQMFRQPNIVFHHDIRSSPSCHNPTAIKPQSNQETDEPADLICFNPYHYEISPEAEARFLKQEKKAAKDSPISKPVKKKPSGVPAPGASTSDDDERGGDDFVDDGTDYVKLWTDHAKDPESDEMIEFDEEQMLAEIRCLQWNPEDKKFVDLESELLQKLKIKEEIRNLIFSGKYVDEIKKVKSKTDQKPAADEAKKQPQPPVATQSLPTEDIVLESITGNETMEERYVSPAKTTVTDMALSSTFADEDKASTEQTKTGDDDNAIQDLLEDIRGSFERQFDDEFDGLTGEGGNSADANTAADEQSLGNIENAFSMNTDQQTAMDIPDFAFDGNQNDGGDADQELCIINSWTVPENESSGQATEQTGTGSSGNASGGFLTAGTISQEEFDNFFPMVDETSAESQQTFEPGSSSNFDPFDQRQQQ